MTEPITLATIAAAIAPDADGRIPGDLAALERAFDAFVLFPAGDGLSDFVGPDAMLSALTDGVCSHLVGDYNPLPEPVLTACLNYAATYHGTLLGFTYKDAAAMAVANWHGFRERFAAAAPA